MTTLLSGLICILVGAGVWIYSGNFPELPEGNPGPSLFPRIIAAGFVISGIALVVAGIRSRRREALSAPERSGLLRVGAGLTIVCLYPLFQGLAGTIAALAMVCLIVALALGVRLLTAVVTAVASAALIYVAFNQLLGVPL